MNIQNNPHLILSPEHLQARSLRQQNMQTALLDPTVNVATFSSQQAAAYRGYGAEVMMSVTTVQNFCGGFPPLPPHGGMGMGMGMMDPFMGMGFMPPMGMGAPMMGGMGYGHPGMIDQSMMYLMMMVQQDMLMQMLMLLLMDQCQVQVPDGGQAPPVDGTNPTDPEAGAKEKAMTPVRAAEILLKYSQLLDTAAGIGERDGLIGLKDLREALKSPDLPEELRQAIEYVLNNPMVLNALDVASGKGKVDGLISVGDLETFIKENKDKPGVDIPQEEIEAEEVEYIEEAGEVSEPEAEEDELEAIDAARALLENFGAVAELSGRKGQIERQDLLEAVNSDEFSEDLKAAAQFFIDNPEVFTEICKSGFLTSSKRATKRNLERWIRRNS